MPDIQLGNWVVAVLRYAWPAFVLPSIIGVVLLILKQKDKLSLFATLMVIKPIIATPLWAVAWFYSMQPMKISYAITLLPGVLITLVLVTVFYPLLRTHTSLVIFLLVCDAARWINTYLLYEPSLQQFTSNLYLVALVLPNLYALMVLGIELVHRKKTNQAIQNSFLSP